MKLNRTLSKCLRKIGKHAPLILSVTSGVTAVVSVIAAADAAVKTEETLQRKKANNLIDIFNRRHHNGNKISSYEDIKEVLDIVDNDKYTLTPKEAIDIWWFPVVLTAETLFIIAANHRINSIRYDRLHRSASILIGSSVAALGKYQNKVIDRCGPEVDNMIRTDIAKDELSAAHERYKIAQKEAIEFDFIDEVLTHADDPDKNLTFYDKNVGYFEVSPNRILAAMYDFNRKLQTDGYVSLQHWYDALGTRAKNDELDTYAYLHGWTWEDLAPVGICWFDIELSVNELDDGMQIYEFVYPASEIDISDYY